MFRAFFRDALASGGAFAALDARDGLTLEASLLAPIALAWIAIHPSTSGISPPPAWPQALKDKIRDLKTKMPNDMVNKSIRIN